MTILDNIDKLTETIQQHISDFDKDTLGAVDDFMKNLNDEKNLLNYTMLQSTLQDLSDSFKTQVSKSTKEVKKSLESINKEIKDVQMMMEQQGEGDNKEQFNFSTLSKVWDLLTKFPPNPVVDNVDIDAYMGKWVQYKASLFALGVESFGTHNTATYSRIDENTIKVLNENKNIFGAENSIEGTATVLDPPKGSLKVSFSRFDNSKEPNYLIVKLGRITNNQYTYSIVVSPSNWFIFVLVRDLKDTCVLAEVDSAIKELNLTNVFSELVTA